MLDGYLRPTTRLGALGDRLGGPISTPAFNVVDFTFSAYERMLDAALAADYEFLTVAEYLDATTLPERFVVLRHDVDRRAANSRAMAELERGRDVSATYYVREHLLDAGFLGDLDAAGHEVGYHYEDLTATRGDHDRALARFARNLRRFREHVDVRTVCAHGNPLTPVHNRDLLREDGALADHDLAGDAALSVDCSTTEDADLRYFSDTGRRWGSVVPGFGRVHTTEDVTAVFEAGRCERAYVLVHPCRWARTRTELAGRVAWDAGAESAKAVADALHGGKC